MVSKLIESFYGKLIAQCNIDIDQSRHAIMILLEDMERYSELDNKTKMYLEELKSEVIEYYRNNKTDVDNDKFKKDVLLRLKHLEDKCNRI